MQNWEIVGKIITPKKKGYCLTHCMVPTVTKIKKSLVRVYFSSRDKFNISRVFCCDYDLVSNKVKNYKNKIRLDIGELGAFDDNGVTPSCILKKNKNEYMFYIGWNKKSKVRMNLFGGLAVKKKNQSKFARVLKCPIIERSNNEYLFNTAPFVIKNKDLFVMYYSSTIKWINKNTPSYNIKYATSNDLINWKRNNKVAISLKKNEVAAGRPCLIYENKKFRMWYSYKGINYKIGYAESTDGKKWIRKDHLVKFKNKKNFNFKMMEFTHVMRHENYLYMFFNANNYGEHGIYLAKINE